MPLSSYISLFRLTIRLSSSPKIKVAKGPKIYRKELLVAPGSCVNWEVNHYYLVFAPLAYENSFTFD